MQGLLVVCSGVGAAWCSGVGAAWCSSEGGASCSGASCIVLWYILQWCGWCIT